MSEPSFLAQLDVGVPGALWRTALGAGFTLAMIHSPMPIPAWAVPLLFLATLFSIKVGAAVARKVVPASAEVRLDWERRRNLARGYDSYQWRKLLWFGLGILAVASWTPPADWQIPLGVACAFSGGVAQIVWRRTAPLLTVDGWLKVVPDGNAAKS